MIHKSCVKLFYHIEVQMTLRIQIITVQTLWRSNLTLVFFTICIFSKNGLRQQNQKDHKHRFHFYTFRSILCHKINKFSIKQFFFLPLPQVLSLIPARNSNALQKISVDAHSTSSYFKCRALTKNYPQTLKWARWCWMLPNYENERKKKCNWIWNTRKQHALKIYNNR